VLVAIYQKYILKKKLMDEDIFYIHGIGSEHVPLVVEVGSDLD